MSIFHVKAEVLFHSMLHQPVFLVEELHVLWAGVRFKSLEFIPYSACLSRLPPLEWQFAKC